MPVSLSSLRSAHVLQLPPDSCAGMLLLTCSLDLALKQPHSMQEPLIGGKHALQDTPAHLSTAPIRPCKQTLH